jgi:hypothetical protein
LLCVVVVTDEKATAVPLGEFTRDELIGEKTSELVRAREGRARREAGGAIELVLDASRCG